MGIKQTESRMYRLSDTRPSACTLESVAWECLRRAKGKFEFNYDIAITWVMRMFGESEEYAEMCVNEAIKKCFIKEI